MRYSQFHLPSVCCGFYKLGHT
ncbi:unnamed protein product [Cuscuta europaea]|uniref:Uncharacterized protein n=1 Tax=Cuscuta europaea TaxID=41803 RepID=A0A9P1E0D5_CUSEU|nr:unnamed protein product [Cuscuta europaea]